jgi:hypothetical protein
MSSELLALAASLAAVVAAIYVLDWLQRSVAGALGRDKPAAGNSDVPGGRSSQARQRALVRNQQEDASEQSRPLGKRL